MLIARNTLLSIVISTIYLFSVADAHAQSRPLTLYLTFIDDPLTQITVNWHSHHNIGQPLVEYRIKGENIWFKKQGYTINFPHSERYIHRISLSDLKPGSVYEFRLEDNSRVYTFRTLPAELTNSLTFVTGGDLFHNRQFMDETSRAAAAVSPYFVAIGGDLAYADGLPEKVSRWYDFFDSWSTTMITPEGYLIPMVPGIGNHEVIGGFGKSHQDATFFFDLFGIPDRRAYYSVNAGDYLSIILLDTDHTNPIDGAQTEWLSRELQKHEDKLHIFPVYHIPAYPSHRNYESFRNVLIRKHWVPLFERYGVRIAFENHDHTFKRTHPLLNNQINPEGITYIGDGAWGIHTREPQPYWYINSSAAERHFLKVTINKNQSIVSAMVPDGRLLDSYSKILSRRVSSIQNSQPSESRLKQNYPNPFNPQTVIPIQLDSRQFVTIEVFDIRGNKVRTLYNDTMASGNHSVFFRPDGLASGAYFARMRTEDATKTIKMLFIQ